MGRCHRGLGYPRQYEHPTGGLGHPMNLAICKQLQRACAAIRMSTRRMSRPIEQGFRFLMRPFVAVLRGAGKT